MTPARLPRLADLDAESWSDADAHAFEVKARELSKYLVENENAQAICAAKEHVCTSLRQTAALLRSEVAELESNARQLRAAER